VRSSTVPWLSIVEPWLANLYPGTPAKREETLAAASIVMPLPMVRPTLQPREL
jgi:hypothetical protein